MPFLGQDWRSPGEQWVRTSEGWERLGLWRLKVFENLNENAMHRLFKLASDELLSAQQTEFDFQPSQPYVIVKEVTKEQKMQTCVADALTRLDIDGAVRDHKRVNYVYKLILYLIQHKMFSLSGMSQKIVVNVLQQIVNHAVKTHYNLRIAQRLLDEMEDVLQKGIYCHVGSQQLWENHCTVVSRLSASMASIDIPERADDGKLMISDLPDEVLRCILMQLADHEDLINAGLAESRAFALCEEMGFWRNLCYFHFDKQYWHCILKRNESLETVGWKNLYMRLAKRFGLRDVFAEQLHLCRRCNALFWELHGHPCPFSNADLLSRPVSPKMFVELFSV